MGHCMKKTAITICKEAAGLDRRALVFGSAVVGASGLLAGAPKDPSGSVPRGSASASPITASYSKGIVETTSGKVRGYTNRGVLVFAGFRMALRRAAPSVSCHLRNQSPGQG